MSERNEPTVSDPRTVLELGAPVRWGRNVVLGPRCRRVSIGFGAFIGNDIYIDVEELEIGDYFTMHHGGVIHGRRCLIGHNCWIGHYSILDALGGLLRLGNNVGVGAHSQLWSHLQFGDLLAGCRWYRQSELIVGDDAGHARAHQRRGMSSGPAFRASPTRTASQVRAQGRPAPQTPRVIPLRAAPSPVHGKEGVRPPVPLPQLRWRRVGSLIRFVLVEHPTRGHLTLLTTRLELDPLQVIALYGARFKAEVGLKEAKAAPVAHAAHAAHF